MRCIIAGILATLSAQIASAQGTSTEVRPGVKIRIEAPGIAAGRVEGSVLSRTDDALVIGGPEMQPLTIPMNRITSLEISRGKSHGDGALRGIEWGAPIGLGLGLLVAPIADVCNNYGYGTSCTSGTAGEKAAVVAISTFSGVFYGAIIGALIGREHWDSFALQPRVSLMRGVGAPGPYPQIGVSVGFSMR